jgi:UDP-4-amino-4-deoxy-L-arabinose-oxoglutarate aminotransferase
MDAKPAQSPPRSVDGKPANIPFCRPTLEQEEIDTVVASLKSGWITTGPKVIEFERMFRERFHQPHALALNSATAGLHVVLAALGIGPGDEVITTPLTWPATTNVVELLGAKTVFAEVLDGSLLIDPADVKRRITPRTKAIIPVHYCGAPADLDALHAAIDSSGGKGRITLIEDAAHALGTEYKGRPTGVGSDPVVFSFHPIKNITTGEGGMVMTDRADLAERMRILRFHGVQKDSWTRYASGGSPRYEVLEPGWKYNMLDLQAGLGIEQLKKLERFNHRRAELAALYLDLLKGVEEVRPLTRPAYPHVHAWHLFIVRLALDRLDVGRDEFFAELGADGIGCGLHFTPVHLHRHYAQKYGWKAGDLPVAERAGEEMFSLPLYPLLSEDDVRRVVDTMKRRVARHRRSGAAAGRAGNA